MSHLTIKENEVRRTKNDEVSLKEIQSPGPDKKRGKYNSMQDNHLY